MPGSDEIRKKEKIHSDFLILTPNEVVHPHEKLSQNIRARGSVLKKLGRTRASSKTNSRIKAPGREDAEEFLFSIFKETFPPTWLQDPTDHPVPHELWNGHRLKELSTKQHHDIIERLRKQIKNEDQLCSIVAEEKKMFLQELRQTRMQLSSKQQQLQSTDKEFDQEHDEFRSKLKVNKQKLKHLMSEQYTQSYLAKTKVLGNLLPTYKEAWQLQHSSYEGLMKIKQTDRNEKFLFERLLQETRLTQTKENQIRREEFQTIQEVMAENFIDFVEETRKDTEEVLKDRVLYLDGLRNQQVNHMLEEQAKSYNGLRNYYQDIGSSNADMIRNLKGEVDSRRAKLDQLEKSILHALEDFSRHRAPLQNVEDEILQCEKILERAKGIRQRFSKKHLRRRLLTEDIQRYRWTKEVETTQTQKSKDQLEELKKAYFQTRFEIFRKSALSNLIYSNASKLMSGEASMPESSENILCQMSEEGPAARIATEQSIQELLND